MYFIGKLPALSLIGIKLLRRLQFFTEEILFKMPLFSITFRHFLPYSRYYYYFTRKNNNIDNNIFLSV